MIHELTATNVTLDDRTSRYVAKKLAALGSYLDKDDRDGVRAKVLLTRVDRPHGNKYEAAVTLVMGARTIEAHDTTLNVLAALDIVCAKLARELKPHKDRRLPRRQNRV